MFGRPQSNCNTMMHILNTGGLRVEDMALEWTLQETRALVEEHVLLKQQEGPEIRTASEHWNKVANRMREQGFYRSHRSCNKRWYRLEQYEIQIFSFNMEEGKHRNYWDLTRAERLEHRAKWPQLPSGDGIDKDIFSSLTRLLRNFEKDASFEATHHEPCVEKKMVPTAHQLEVGSGNRHLAVGSAHVDTATSIPVIVPPPAVIVPTPLVEQSKSSTIVSKQECRATWPIISAEKPLSPQETLDGFKLQARELRRRRAAELRRNNRVVPYDTAHTTFIKTNTQPLPPGAQQHPPLAHPAAAEIKFSAMPSDDQKPSKAVKGSSGTRKHFPATSEPSDLTADFVLHEMDSNPVPQNNIASGHPQPQRPLSNTTNNNLSNFQNNIPSDSTNSTSNFGNVENTKEPFHQAPLPMVQSMNSHLPLLQPNDKYNKQPKPSADQFPSTSEQPPRSELEEELQMVLSGHHGSQLQPQNLEQQLQLNHLHVTTRATPTSHHRRPAADRHSQDAMGGTARMLGAAIEGLEVQLEAMVNLLQAKHAADEKFREKLLLFVECMAVSLHTIAQSNSRQTGPP